MNLKVYRNKKLDLVQTSKLAAIHYLHVAIEKAKPTIKHIDNYFVTHKW